MDESPRKMTVIMIALGVMVAGILVGVLASMDIPKVDPKPAAVMVAGAACTLVTPEATISVHSKTTCDKLATIAVTEGK